MKALPWTSAHRSDPDLCLAFILNSFNQQNWWRCAHGRIAFSLSLLFWCIVSLVMLCGAAMHSCLATDIFAIPGIAQSRRCNESNHLFECWRRGGRKKRI